MKVTLNEQWNTPALLASACGGELCGDAEGVLRLRSICTDSREADAESVFVALRGERVDGHAFIPAVLAAGCRCILCERSSEEISRAGAVSILVKDSELALAHLAGAYKSLCSCRTVAVTGSVGKTTTKDMVHAVLSQGFESFRTSGNHNSLIGLPLSMLEIPQDAAYAVLEMGMSGFGEIERLSRCARPDLAIITNIGTSHMELLGSREHICRAKLEVLCGLAEGGTLLLNGDEPLLSSVKGKSYRTKYISLEREDCDYVAQNIRVEADRTVFDAVCEGRFYKDLTVCVMGRHNVYAALFAVAVGHDAGLGEDAIRQGLLEFRPEGLRQRLVEHKGVSILLDCYNASPESTSAAVSVLSSYAAQTGKRSVAVLGDMLELGADAPAYHRDVGATVADAGIDLLYTVGTLGEQIAIGALQRRMPRSSVLSASSEEGWQEIAELLARTLTTNDAVLIKASRGMRLERIMDVLKEKL